MVENSNKKNILITGCSSGFGLHIAARLAASGHNIFATMRDLSKQNDLAGEVSLRGGKIEILQLDVTNIISVKQAVFKMREKAGKIDVLVNNAGYGIGGFFEDLTQDEIRDQLETNFFGVQNVTREVLPFMREEKKGIIVNISSIAGLYALPCFGAYNASKWALEGFSESLLYELAPFNIKVCLIEPGVYKTKIFYENRRYAKGFFNTKSPYNNFSQAFQKSTNDHLKVTEKDPEEIAILVEKLINAKNPAFRNIPDSNSRFLYAMRRFLPFRLFSTLTKHFVYSSIK